MVNINFTSISCKKVSQSRKTIDKIFSLMHLYVSL